MSPSFPATSGRARVAPVRAAHLARTKAGLPLQLRTGLAENPLLDLSMRRHARHAWGKVMLAGELCWDKRVPGLLVLAKSADGHELTIEV
jgi:hypothetical protein